MLSAWCRAVNPSRGASPSHSEVGRRDESGDNFGSDEVWKL